MVKHGETNIITNVVIKTIPMIINKPHLGMVYTTHKNGDDLGMVYDCFNHIMGYLITNIMAEHPIGTPKFPMPLWDPWSGVQDYCNSNPGTTSTLLEM